jgi:predicted Zn-dependent peptidase
MDTKTYRKCIFSTNLIIFCLLFVIPSYSQEKDQTKYFELENGLRVFLYEKHTLPLLNIVFAVNLGTKDESDETSGLVHILEHYILFRGTELRSGSEISRDIRRHGAYFNAHTSLDLATFEISLPSEYADFALRNQKEILFNLKLSQKELDEEKKVILEELSHIEDDPIRYANSLVYQNLFKDHPYQNPTQGKKEIIEASTVEQIEEFYRKFFVPNNCTLAVVGDFKIEGMEGKVKDIFGDLAKKEIASVKYEKARIPEKTIEIEQEMDINQAYLVIGMIGPDFNHPDQHSIDVITEILGRGLNPMMYYRLRGRRNLVHSVSMGYSAHKYGGAIFIYITLDSKNASFARREAIKFLKDTRSLDYSKKDLVGESQMYAIDYLESAKNQIKFKFHRSQEEGLNIAFSLARYMLLNENEERGGYLESIEKISSSDLRKVAGQYLSKGRYIIASIFPKKKQ